MPSMRHADGMAQLRVVGPDDWTAWRELRLTALEESPDAFGSRLADWQGAGEERWRDRLTSVPFNVMALDDAQVGPAVGAAAGAAAGAAGGHAVGMAVGMASGVPGDTSTVELISMYVRRDERGGPVARQLVEAVADWAREQGAEALVLAVRASNDRARAFYRGCGFDDVGLAESEPGEPPEIAMRVSLATSQQHSH